MRSPAIVACLSLLLAAGCADTARPGARPDGARAADGARDGAEVADLAVGAPGPEAGGTRADAADAALDAPPDVPQPVDAAPDLPADSSAVALDSGEDGGDETPVFFDDFEDGVADGWKTRQGLGTDWSVIQEGPGWSFEQASLASSGWQIAYAETPRWQDQAVEARIKLVAFYGPSPAYLVALFVRYDAVTDSGYYMALRGDGTMTLRKRVAGSSSSFGPGVDIGLLPGRWYTLRLEIVGNVLSGYLDGEWRYGATDASQLLAAGGPALGSSGASFLVDEVGVTIQQAP